jgi:exonuclease VII small subunit
LKGQGENPVMERILRTNGPEIREAKVKRLFTECKALMEQYDEALHRREELVKELEQLDLELQRARKQFGEAE